MLYKSKRKRLYKAFLFLGVLCLAGFATFSCTDEYDLDDKQPSGGMHTIYGYMQSQGNFKNFLHLIDDLGYDEVLAKTGSKTLFPADDDAFNEFYANNDWGVSSYEDLSVAQKKILLNAAIIDNPYPTSMLSTAEGPVKGEVCRRMSSMSIFDTVQVVSTYSDELPQTPLWLELRNHDEVVLFKDASGSQPMVHFTPKFLDANQIESTDVDFLYNDPAGTRQSDETYVNNSKIVRSVNCKNGFVHVVNKVIVPLDNMAEIIRKNDNMNTFSGIVERFAAPKDSTALTRAYNENKGTEYDSVFVKRYFSDRSWGSGTEMSTRRPFAFDKNGNPFDAALKFDPGWNTFVPEIFNNRTPMMEDMAVMLVPTDAAMSEWWNNGGGKVIKDHYGSIEDTPNSVLAELVNVNMLNSLVSSVPSRFHTILNDANEPMNVSLGSINQVYLGCNGVIYETNKVYAPASYSSVLFPAVIDTENLGIIKNAIDNLDYAAYLNSMVSNYSFFIPTNDGMLCYIDPVSFNKTATEWWEFHLDPKKAKTKQIYADVYAYTQDPATGIWTKAEKRSRRVENGTDNAQLKNRLEDILDNIIGVEGSSADKSFIITKGKNYIKLGGTYDVAGSMTASGTWQVETGEPCVVKEIYNMENGKAFIVDGILMGTRKTVSNILAENPDFSEFYSILEQSDILGTKTSENYTAGAPESVPPYTYGNLITISGSGSNEKVYSMLNAFHYTVYAPTNAAMAEAYAAGLPTLDDLANAIAYDEANETNTASEIKSVMRDFVRYHIQNNSIYLDNGFATGNYESLKNKYEFLLDDAGNPVTVNEDGITKYKSIAGSPYRINISSVSPSAMTITDAMGNTRHVVTSGGLYNLMAREYWIKSSTSATGSAIENSSSIVVQAIDGPLFFDKDQFVYVPRSVVSDDNVKQRRIQQRK